VTAFGGILSVADQESHFQLPLALFAKRLLATATDIRQCNGDKPGGRQQSESGRRQNTSWLRIF